MKRSELEEIIMEEIYKTLAEMRELNPEMLQEKSVPQPYDRKNRRRMSGSQIARRDKLGKAMKANKKVVAKFKKQHGGEWEDYLWATATSRAIKGGEQK
jgi:hypothetical protein